MLIARMNAAVISGIRHLQRFVDRWWYPPALGAAAFADIFVIVLPTDGLLVSSAMLRPKRWFSLAFFLAAGSTLAQILLAALVVHKGLPWALHMYPGIEATQTWIWAERFFAEYGLYLVFAIAASPFFQQPTVIIAALSHTPLWKIAAIVFAGRFIKNLFLSYLASHAPRFIPKVWGLQGELEGLPTGISGSRTLQDRSEAQNTQPNDQKGKT